MQGKVDTGCVFTKLQGWFVYSYIFLFNRCKKKINVYSASFQMLLALSDDLFLLMFLTWKHKEVVEETLTSQMQVCVLLGDRTVELSQWSELSSLGLSRLHVKSGKNKTCFSNWGKISVPGHVSFAHWCVLLGENNLRILKIRHTSFCAAIISWRW